MELEQYKSAWQKQSVLGSSLPSSEHLSRSLQFVRTNAIRDWQRSEEFSRPVMSLLFALVLIAVALEVMLTSASRIAAWLFAMALLADGIGGAALLLRRWREPATATMLEFISRELRQVTTRMQFEKYSQRLMLVLGAVILGLLIFGAHPAVSRENALDSLARMGVLTAFLAVAWRRTKSRSGEICRELEHYLKELHNG
jgi:hypothetical protein